MPDIPMPPEPCAVARLQDRLERGTHLLTAAELSHGQVRMWTASVRAPLRDIYGLESPIFADWPAASGPLPQGEARTLLTTRLSSLTALISQLRSNELTRATPGTRVFLGHGRSPVWRELKDFLVDRLTLSWEEFNREATAGIATTERIVQMLDSACFAFLIMTAEDEHADASLHARENVIHEVGLFQGRLGTRKAIILLEDGCATFSNIHGLTYIAFPRGRISAAFEEIRRVLEREQVTSS